MSSGSTNFLIETRQFPFDEVEFPNVMNKTYVEIARAVNARVFGGYQIIQVTTGERWPNTTNSLFPRQSYRKVFIISAIAAGATLNISHNITGIVQVTKWFGSCVTDVPDFRPIPYASATDVLEQIEIKVTATQITIINGANAPNIVSGTIALEYLLN